MKCDLTNRGRKRNVNLYVLHCSSLRYFHYTPTTSPGSPPASPFRTIIRNFLFHLWTTRLVSLEVDVAVLHERYRWLRKTYSSWRWACIGGPRLQGRQSCLLTSMWRQTPPIEASRKSSWLPSVMTRNKGNYGSVECIRRFQSFLGAYYLQFEKSDGDDWEGNRWFYTMLSWIECILCGKGMN